MPCRAVGGAVDARSRRMLASREAQANRVFAPKAGASGLRFDFFRTIRKIETRCRIAWSGVELDGRTHSSTGFRVDAGLLALLVDACPHPLAS